MAKIGRNDRCPCGSEKKYKHCHGRFARTGHSLPGSDTTDEDSIDAPQRTATLQDFWIEFHRAISFANEGLYLPAIEIVESLYANPKKRQFDPDRNLDYTYAVLLQQSPRGQDDLLLSVKLLRGLIDRPGGGAGKRDNALIRAELASGLILLNKFASAADMARQAIARAAPASPARSLAQQNLGRALHEQNQFDDAEPVFLEMIDSALAAERLVQAGIAAEWLARIALRRLNREVAAAWCALTRDVYRMTAPQHLQSASDVLAEVGRGVPPAPLNALPLQARTLRDRTPPGGELGEWAGIHLDSMQVDLGALRQIADLPHDQEAALLIPVLPEAKQIAGQFGALLAAESGSIIPHDWADDVIATLLRELWPEHAEASLARQRAGGTGRWESTIVNGPPSFRWRSAGAAPAAFGNEFRMLAVLFLAGVKGRMDKVLELSNLLKRHGFSQSTGPQFINLSNRAWPRPVHAAMIAHGQAAAGGDMGPAHLAEDVTRIRVALPAENRDAFIRLGCRPDEADCLDRGGLIALKATELVPPGGGAPRFIGTTPLNEINVANLPAAELKPDETRPFFVIDREYNTWFFAPSPAQPDMAVYGVNNALFRDHFAPFHAQVDIVGSVRSKHYAVPIIEIRSCDELARITGLLDAAADRLKPTKHVAPDARVWYRGQTRSYLLQRPELVSRFLFGRPGVQEPSLPGAAPRRRLNYFKVHSFLSTMLQAEIYRRGSRHGEPFDLTYERWRELASSPGSWDLGVMALAQHYGIPTTGIDVTHDPGVALWFATNALKRREDGQYTYRELSARNWPSSTADWPVIYAILPVVHSLDGAIRDIDLLKPLGIHALRPARQKGAFFMGATGLHRNRLAEALVCVLRLAPGAWESGYGYRQLFPPVEEDEMYAWMIDLRARYTHGDIGGLLAEIPSYD